MFMSLFGRKKVEIYKPIYWYVCNDHTNIVLRREHIKCTRERECMENMKY